jgi:hypothetical protein
MLSSELLLAGWNAGVSQHRNPRHPPGVHQPPTAQRPRRHQLSRKWDLVWNPDPFNTASAHRNLELSFRSRNLVYVSSSPYLITFNLR